ncbi:SusC/RagA family TonB-linked outer membrane protein [Zunongwangia sp. HRR-M8]|uniref:SusC/RagA family TonB-linked outer membrane protein n=1 Tax=Zunongwangia sp. HRR-M8 TaxID=3015170 RepID=UPI0022DE1344|nr:TonB-dependent receptor [Zunongwangia sp. HRR-M8]WBL21485.1 TonB-dependent receptor [Zunongwangia sp. HRR-M8]
MKSFIFLFCTTVFSFSSNNILSQNAKIYVKEDKLVSVDEVLNLVMSQTDYVFVYQSDLFKNSSKIDLKEGAIKANELLNYSLADSKFDFVYDGEYTIVFKEKPKSSQQVIAITGKVTDKEDMPLPGLTVYITNKEPTIKNGKADNDNIVRGTVTDFDGVFSIKATVGEFLVVSGVGYEAYYQKVESTSTDVSITLKEEMNSLEEVMVVGYGTTRKKDLTGSVGSVKAEALQQIKTQTLDQALVGQVAGVYVQNRGGQPGAGAFVQVRGLSQIRGDNQPLYVIDGVPINITPNTESLGIINYGSRENPLLSINPDDIERVDILKDASAAAIYGSRAANGVVIVTTKRGKRGEAPRLSFNVSSTFQNPVDTYDYLDASGYISWTQANARRILSGVPEENWESAYPVQYNILNNPDSYFGNANTNWQDLITNKNALWTKYSLSVSGGTEKASYFTSLGISDQDGVMIGNNFKRYNLSTNVDANVTDRLKVGTSINYNYTVNKNNGFTSLSQGEFRPDLGPYNEDGSYSTFDGEYGEQFTLLGNGNQIRDKRISKNLLATIFGEYEIIDDLKFKSRISIGLKEDNIDEFYTSKSTEALYEGLYYSRPGAALGVQTNNNWSTTFTNTLNFNKTINNDHTIDAVVGVSWDRSRYDAESQTYRGFPDDDILTNIASASFFDNANSESLQQGLNSVFGRINYNYKSKYLATFTARRDGSTKFGPDNQFGFFPSGALAWNMHNEDFLKEVSFINQLKLRASLGRVGSDNLPSFTYLSYYQALENGDSYYDGQNGIAVTGVPNTGIRWEETDQLDLGAEFSLFNNRLNAEIVYYEKNTSGIILFSPIPAETGFNSWNTNIADVSNKGWEITIGGDIIRNKNFTWNSSLNIATIKNNVDHLYGSNSGDQTGIVEGQPIGVIMGYDVIKIVQTQEEIDELNSTVDGRYQSSLRQPGDYLFKDINGDGKVNTNDRTPIGNPNPDFFGGWNNRLSYKNWSLNMNWNFVSGAEREYEMITKLRSIDINSNITNLVSNTWAEDNTDATYARHGSRSHGSTPSSKSIVDASYIKLRSASISYNLPKKWFGDTGISNTRLTLSGNNLITITDYPGLDPEDVSSFGFANRSTNFNSDDGLSYPNVRTFTFALNVTF